MCVTNTVVRRPRPIALPTAGTVSGSHGPRTSVASSQARPCTVGETSPTFSNVQQLYGNSLLSAIACGTGRANIRSGNMGHDVGHSKDGFQKTKRAKRKRKPQQPGFTAKHHVRHFVHHDYHDHSRDVDVNAASEESGHGGGSGTFPSTFPLKLHAMLDQIEADGLAHVISWQPHGRAFKIHKPKDFVNHVMPLYFRQTKLTSFQRQLNLYGFQRLTKGDDDRAYYHELFLRGKNFLSKRIVRTKVKGTGFKAASSPDDEPDFFAMDPVLVTSPPSVSSESCDEGEETDREFSLLMLETSMQLINRNPIPSPPKSRCYHESKITLGPPVNYATAPAPTQKASQGEAESPPTLNEIVDDVFDDGEGCLCEDVAVLDFVNSWADTGQQQAPFVCKTETMPQPCSAIDTTFSCFLEKMMAV